MKPDNEPNIKKDTTLFIVREQRWPLKVQITVTVLCTVLNLLLNILVSRYGIPLYLDMIFTLFAAYFGWISALAVPVLYHFTEPFLPYGDILTIPFLICSITGALILRLFLQKNKKIEPLDLIMLSIVISFAICIEGGVIYTVVFTLFKYKELTATRFLTISLIMQNIPLMLSAILARIPVSFIDKTLSVFVSWGLMLGLQKIKERNRNSLISR